MGYTGHNHCKTTELHQQAKRVGRDHAVTRYATTSYDVRRRDSLILVTFSAARRCLLFATRLSVAACFSAALNSALATCCEDRANLTLAFALAASSALTRALILTLTPPLAALVLAALAALAATYSAFSADVVSHTLLCKTCLSHTTRASAAIISANISSLSQLDIIPRLSLGSVPYPHCTRPTSGVKPRRCERVRAGRCGALQISAPQIRRLARSAVSDHSRAAHKKRPPHWDDRIDCVDSAGQFPR